MSRRRTFVVRCHLLIPWADGDGAGPDADDIPLTCSCRTPRPSPVRLWGTVLVAGVSECAGCGRPTHLRSEHR